MKKILKLFLFVILFNPVYSQNSWSFISSVRHGFLLPHRPSLSYFNDRHVNELTVEVSHQLNDTNQWHKLYRLPNIGGGFYYTKLPTTYYTGKSFAGYCFIDIPIKWKRRHSLNYSIGTGIAYLTKHFDNTTNYYNIAIGSSLNAYINLGLYYSLYFNHFQINTGVSFTHYSNGAWKKPNLGFNIPTIKISMGYLYQPKTPYTQIAQYKKNKYNATEYEFMVSSGIRQNYPADPHSYIVTNFAFTLEKYISLKRKLGAGIDFYYDPSIPIREQTIPNFNIQTPYYRSGFRFSHDLIFNRMSITMQTGFYFFDPLLSDGIVYSKFGIRYNINSWLRANVLLKSHFAKADVIEFGLSFYKQKRRTQK